MSFADFARQQWPLQKRPLTASVPVNPRPFKAGDRVDFNGRNNEPLGPTFEITITHVYRNRNRVRVLIRDFFVGSRYHYVLDLSSIVHYSNPSW